MGVGTGVGVGVGVGVGLGMGAAGSGNQATEWTAPEPPVFQRKVICAKVGVRAR